MASYAEIRTLFNDSDLKNKVATAVIIAALGILGESTPDAARIGWAARAFESPEREAKRVFMAVLAANNTATVADIEGAPDATIQVSVDAAIDLFVAADAGV